MPTQTAAYIDAIRHLPPGSELIVPNVSWVEYEELLTELGEGYAVRVTYDDGRLEVATPSSTHEKSKDFILRLANLLADELGLGLETFGSTTFKAEALKQGTEPDTCFYVQRAAEVIGQDDLDPVVFPPDVVVEVDVSQSSLKKLAFYAQVGVPEVWRYDGTRASMYRLTGSRYEEIPGSLAFPLLTADTLTGLLQPLRAEGQQAVLAAFRKSLRAR